MASVLATLAAMANHHHHQLCLLLLLLPVASHARNTITRGKPLMGNETLV